MVSGWDVDAGIMKKEGNDSKVNDGLESLLISFYFKLAKVIKLYSLLSSIIL